MAHLFTDLGECLREFGMHLEAAGKALQKSHTTLREIGDLAQKQSDQIDALMNEFSDAKKRAAAVTAQKLARVERYRELKDRKAGRREKSLDLSERKSSKRKKAKG